MTNEEDTKSSKHQKIKLNEINSYILCRLCKGYLIDATTISECLHSFCRSCIIKFLQDQSHCPVCELLINKAKPNLKLDKTLQDIVYKLVPELFLNEMRRRQIFYRDHPIEAARVSPEQRGEDTERIIFNPRDVFSLSLEYISDDSTPGAICLPSIKAESNFSSTEKDGSQKEAVDKSMRRFLQCPGMCRVDVLKKFVRNKYNVNTSKFHIDILYKRVPLPDHYTLIDVAYIYSWKRNEPMKFFFRITDINLVKSRFDYLAPTIPLNPIPACSTIKVKTEKPSKSVRFNIQNPNSHDNIKKITSHVSSKINSDKVAEETEKIKDQIKNGEEPVTTNITVNKSKDVEIIAKIQKVSNKNGQPIGLNIKQTVKKPIRRLEITNLKNINGIVAKEDKNNPKNGDTNSKCDNKINNEIKKDNNTTELKKNIRKEQEISSKTKTSEQKVFPSALALATDLSNKETNNGKSDKVNTKLEDSQTKVPNTLSSTKNVNGDPSIVSDNKDKAVKSIGNLDLEKERFLNSFDLASKELVQSLPKKPRMSEAELLKLTKSLKRKATSPKSAEKAKKPKIERKLSKITKKSKVLKKLIEPADNLKTLLNTCKIPSSLSITCVEGERETQIKPVINHIEILKLPETPKEDETKQRKDLEKVGTTMHPTSSKKEEENKNVNNVVNKDGKPELSITITVEKTEGEKQVNKPIGIHPNLPKVLPSAVSTTPRPIHSFQKMFEDTVKKVDNKISNGNKTKGGEANGHKRNILEIASQLYKKTKLEQEKNLQIKDAQRLNVNANGKIAIPRLNSQKSLLKSVDVRKGSPANYQQTVSNLHSASLGLNYSVSINKEGQKSEVKTSVPIKTNVPSLNNVIKPNQNLNERLGLKLPSPQNLSKTSPRNANFSTPQTPKLSPVLNMPKLPSPQTPKLSPKISSSPQPSPFSPRAPASPALLSPGRPPSRASTSPHPSSSSPRLQNTPGPRPVSSSPQPASSSPQTNSSSSHPSSSSPRSLPAQKESQGMDPNKILEQYNIQNLAQLTANFNFNPAALNPQFAAIQHAMLLKQLELQQNRQNWLSMNSNPIAHYEKFLKSLGANGQKILSNIKEN